MTTDDPTEVLSNPTPPPMPPSRSAFDGLTVRDMAAMHALAGVLAAHAGGEISLPSDEEAAKLAVSYGDALLIRLALTPFPG